MRHFLVRSDCQSGQDVVNKACTDVEPGSIALLLLAVKIRANRETRRTFQQVARAMCSGIQFKLLAFSLNTRVVLLAV